MEYLVICFFCGLSAAFIGRWKGSSFVLWFLIGAVLPIIGIAAALLWRFEDNEPRRQCAECGRVIPVYQQVCMSCGADQPWPSEPIPSGSR
jgi:hypothetical protein